MRRLVVPSLIAAVAGALFLVSPVAAQMTPIAPPAKSAQPAAKTKVKPFRLGIVAASRPEAAIERVDPFRRQLARVLETEVVVSAYDDEAALIGALVAGRVDYAPLSAMGYATAARLCDCVEPLAAPRDADRAPGWFAVVVAKAGGGIVKAGDLARRRLAVSADEAIGTRRLPLMLLGRTGLTEAESPRLVETAGPSEALRALLDGRADAAVVWSSLDGDPDTGWSRGTITEFVERGEIRASQLKVVWSSPILPLGPHTVKADLEEGRKRRLREMLIELDADPEISDAIEPIHSGGFVRVGAPAYRPFVDLLTPPSEPDRAPETTGSAPPKG